MIRLPPRSTRTDTLFPYTTLFRSLGGFAPAGSRPAAAPDRFAILPPRSEEHTSELQSLMRISYAVFCLKKKKTKHSYNVTDHHTSPMLENSKYTNNLLYNNQCNRVHKNDIISVLHTHDNKII